MITLREHQLQAVNQILNLVFFTNKRGFLLADETGLGKTFSAVAAMGRALTFYRANKQPEATLLIVCPLSVLVAWEEACAAMGYPLAALPIQVINYQKLKQFFIKGTNQVARQPTFIVFDEAHNLKGYTSKAQQRALALMVEAEFVLFLTATPAQSPLELGYLQPILGFSNFFSWLHRCAFQISKDGRHNSFTWTPNSVDTAFIAQAIYSSGLGLRRRPEELDGWPARQVEILPVRLGGAEMSAYRRSLEDYLERRRNLGFDPRFSEETLRLVEVGQLRARLSDLKVAYTAQAALDYIVAGHQVAIFCLFRQSAQALHLFLQKTIPTGILTGSESDPRIRDNIVQDFRWGRTKAIIFTVFEGINLEQPTLDHPTRIQLNHDLPWSGIQAHQVNGRCHRNQMRALILNISVLGTIDARVAERVTERARAIGRLAGDEVDVASFTEAEMEAELFGPPTTPNSHAQPSSASPTLLPQ